MTEKSAEATVSFDAGIVLRPRTLDETLDLALRYMRAHARDFAKLIIPLVSAATLLIIGISFFVELTFYQRAAIAILISPFIEQIVTVYGGRHLFMNRPKVWPAVATIFKRFPRVLFTSALISLPFTAMLFTSFKEEGWIVAGGLLGTFWPFLLATQAYRSEVSLLEQLSMKRAAQRTKTLITYRFARTLGLIIVATIVRGAIAGIVEMTTSFVLGFMLQFGDVGDAIGGWPAIAGYLLAGPYVALLRMFDYVDARTRREGWDIQIRFNAIVQDAREAGEKKLGGIKKEGVKAA